MRRSDGNWMNRLLLLFLVWVLQGKVLAAESSVVLRVAVAANFAKIAEHLVADYRKHGGVRVVFSSGSSGALFAQIVQGAPFDVFLAADVSRPEALASRNLILAGSRQTYAIGQLALWDTNLIDAEPASDKNLERLLVRAGRLSIANPETAPYGLAAIQSLKALGILSSIHRQLVRGNSVLQAYQYVETGNVERGLVAFHLIEDKNQSIIIPQHLYAPIKQQMVIIKSSQRKTEAKRFQAFMLSSAVQKHLQSIGFLMSEHDIEKTQSAGE